jgi:hypothetical protein
MVTMVTIAPLAQAAGAFTIGTITGQVSDHVGTTSDYSTPAGDATSNCIRYGTRAFSPAGSVTAGAGAVASPKEALTSHGYPSNSTCPSLLDTSVQSAVGVAPTAITSVTPGTPFQLAVASHYNNPITDNIASYYTGKLNLTLSGFVAPDNAISFAWQMWETPNQADPCAFPSGPNTNGCADQITFTNTTPADYLQASDGTRYKVVINGFDPNNTTCESLPPSIKTSSSFLTAEKAITRACIFATLVQVRSLTIVKATVTGAINRAFPFTSTSDAPASGNSPWKNGAFSLNAAGTTTKTGDLLQGESVSTTEAPQSDPRWKLTAITCTQGAGNTSSPFTPTSADLATGKLTINTTPASDDPDYAAITCIYTNTYTPANLQLVKSVNANGTGDATPATAWTLQGENGVVQTISGAGGTPSTDVVPGTYALSESTVSGYTNGTTWTCKNGDTTKPGVTTVTVGPGDNWVCTVTNTAVAPTLKLVKTVANGTTGGTAAPDNWTLTATGNQAQADVVTNKGGSGAVTTVNVGTYALAEAVTPGSATVTAGYAAGAWSCTNGGSAVSGASVVVKVGDNWVCTIANTPQQATLTLIKNVDNGATGGTATASQWKLTATGSQSTREVRTGPGAASGTTYQVPPGTYTLSETGSATGYKNGTAWTCVNGNAPPTTGTSVTVALGDAWVCTIANTAAQATLQLVKNVDNGKTGRTASAAEWTLTANGTVKTISGAGGTAVENVPTGTYALSESTGPAGYEAGTWMCANKGGAVASGASVTVTLGDAWVCTITNSAVAVNLSKSVAKGGSGWDGRQVAAGDVLTWTITVANTSSVAYTGGFVLR